MGWFDSFLYPLKVAVAWVMVTIHDGLVAIGMSDGPGLAWVLSIVGLTIFVRILIIPLFFKQIKSSRNMQLIQPEMQRIKDKYKGRTDQASKQAQTQEMMALYKEYKANPFSSCMPILLQMPIFFALFRVLASTQNIAAGNYLGQDHLGPLTAQLAQDIEKSSFFGATLSATFLETPVTSTRIVIVVMIIAMAASQFFTMRQLTMKNMPASATDSNNPAVRMQKNMMYMMPLIMGVSGIYFQVGVLIYWFTTNLWSMGQQFYTLERMPAPGSEAWEKRQAKHREKYEVYRKKIEAQYEEKFAQVQTDKEKIEELELEKAAVLRKERVRLELERKDRPKSVTETKSQTQRIQPSKSSRAQRKQTQSDGSIDAQDNASKPISGNLTPEEVARRRYERRAAERARKKKQSKK